MPARVPPLGQTRAQIDELFASKQDLAQVLEQVARPSVRLVMRAALEAQVTEFLDRDRYQQARPGYRNGHAELHEDHRRPGGAGAAQAARHHRAVCLRLLGKRVSRIDAPESLVPSGLVRGLSVQDVEGALAEALGPEAPLSRSAVARVCEQAKDEVDAWKHQDLSGAAALISRPQS